MSESRANKKGKAADVVLVDNYTTKTHRLSAKLEPIVQRRMINGVREYIRDALHIREKK